MEPVSRVAFEYPIYGMDIFDDGTLAVAGGGGRMKSGIPNSCVRDSVSPLFDFSFPAQVDNLLRNLTFVHMFDDFVRNASAPQEVLSFDERNHALTRRASVSLVDAPVALATHGATLITVLGTGCKNFVYKCPTSLTAASNFQYDLRVSSSHEQSAVVVARNGTRLAVASDEGHLTVLQLPHYDLLLSKQLHSQGITDLSISTDGSLIATSARDRAAYICRTDSAEVLQKICPVMPPALRTHVRAIRFAPGQPALIFTVESNPRKGGWIAAWRSPHTSGGHWTPVASMKASNDALTAFAINPTATVAAVSSAEGHVSVFQWNGTSFSRVWSTEPRRMAFKRVPPPHVLPVTAIHFSASSKHLFTASADYTVAVWPTYKPAKWSGVFRGLFLVVSLLVALFAVLLAEDEHLHSALREHRDVVKPFLEPHLSNLQYQVRPVIRRSAEDIRPYLQDLHAVMEPKVGYIRRKVKPVLVAWEQHRAVWELVIVQRLDEISRLLKQGARTLAQLAASIAKKGAPQRDVVGRAIE